MFFNKIHTVSSKPSSMSSYFLSQLLYKNYSLDSRSLVLFRICIAVILLVNFLFTRLPYFDLFHSEKGFLPLLDLIRSGGFFSKTTSLNFIYSGDGFQIFLFILAIICAVFLLFGYRTKWAVFGSWFLLASLHAKTPLIINSGDNLLVLMLFWSLLLPLNGHCSLDKLSEKKIRPFNEFSIGTFAFIGQLLMVYIFTSALKTDVVWKNGSAVYYSLMLDNFRTQWGDILLQYPKVMKGASYVTYYFFEMSVPWLFVFFAWLWPMRIILIFLMMGFHFSLTLFLELGLFSWICMSGWLALLPSEFWDQLNKKSSFIQSKIYDSLSHYKVFLNKILSFNWKRLSAGPPLLSLYSNKTIFRILIIFFGLCFLYILAWNIRSTDFKKYSRYFPTSWNGPGQLFHLHQHWAMFSPKPATKGGWIILSATPRQTDKERNTIESELTKIDLWQGGRPVTMNKPHRYNETFPGFRHRKLIENLIFKSRNKPHLKKYLQYWCRQWNKQHPANKVKNIEFIYMEVVTPPPGEPSLKPTKKSMKKVRCRP